MGLLDPQALEYFGLLGQSMLAGQSPNAGVNIGNAMMYADTEMRRKAAEKARLEEERQQAKMREMAMQKALREQEAQDYMGRGIQQFMRPPQAATQQFGPGDMETPSQLTPGSPGGFDQGGFAQYLAQNPATAQQALQFMPKPREPFKLNKNERLIDPTTNKPIVDAVEEGIKKGTTRVIESGRVKFTYEWDGGQWKQIAKSAIDKPEGESKPQFVESMGGFVTPPKGGQSPGFIPVQGAPASKKNAASEAELTAAGYASRMLAADQALSAMPEKAVPGLRQTLANNSYPTLAPYVSSPEQQQYRQSQEDWVRAKLRKESGAVIADEEMAREIRVYFPQPGDSPQVIKQKATARKRANDAMMIAAGKARDQVPAPQGDNSIDSLVSKYLNR